MATIDNKEVINKLIKNNGYYSDDPRVAIIGEYENRAGKKIWFILYPNEIYRLSEYLVLPKSKILKRYIK